MNKEFTRDIRNGKYERSEEGVYLPKSRVLLSGIFTHDVLHNGELLGEQRDSNLVVNEGLDYVLNAAYRNQTVSANWYIGIYKANFTPLSSTTASSIVSDSTEIAAADVDESTRPAWTIVAPSSQVLTNTASKATYTVASGKSFTAYGAFLIDNATFASTTGVLNSASLFSTSRALVATDQLLITYTLTASDV